MFFHANSYPLNSGIRLIEASAGTGKTFTIAHLALRIITEEKIPISKFLIVTFSEAAANELRARVSSRLEEALRGIESYDKGVNNTTNDLILDEWISLNAKTQSSRKNLSSLILSALENIDFADITTIHGFCAKTLNRNSLECKVNIKPKIEGEETKLVDEIVNNFWSKQALKINPKNLNTLKKGGYNIQNIIKQTLRLDSDPSIKLPNIYFDSNSNLSVKLNQWIKDSWLIFIDSWKKEGKILDEFLINQAKEWKANGNTYTKPFSANPKKDRYELIQQWIYSFRSNSPERINIPTFEDIAKQETLINYYHPARFVERAERIEGEDKNINLSSIQNSIAQLWDGIYEKVWAYSMNQIIKDLNEKRKKNGILSYGGLLTTIRDALTVKEDANDLNSNKTINLKTIMNERYKVFLVDEFQDTDFVQWDILRNCYDQAKKHLMILVGDPKQAIYQFRGGDLKTYVEAKSEVDRIDKLTDNYRTNNNLMLSINSLLDKGLTRSKLDCPKLSPKIQFNSKNNIEKPLQILNLSKDKGLSKSSIEKIIPKEVINYIIDILTKNNLNNYLPSDICIIVNKHIQAENIRKELGKVNIPSRLISKGDVLESNAAENLQYFLDGLADPSESKNIRRIACSDLMQWDIKRIKAMDINGDLDEISAFFEQLAIKLPKIGLTSCINEFLDEQINAELSHNGRFLIDLQQCCQICQEVIYEKKLNAIAAANWLRQQRLRPISPIPENRQPYSDTEEHAVNVITIHRSKGLEFPIVICPYLWQSPPKNKGPLWRSQENKEWIIGNNEYWGSGRKAAKESKLSSLQEAERLAYVAITRAKEQLILVWTSDLKQEGNPLETILFEGISFQECTTNKISTWIAEKKKNFRLIEPNLNRKANKWLPPQETGELSTAKIPRRNLNILWNKSSYSTWIKSLKNVNHQFPEIIDSDNSKDFDQYIMNSDQFDNDIIDLQNTQANIVIQGKSPLSDFPKGAIAGNCLHKILERIDYTVGMDHPDSITIIKEELRSSGIDLDFVESVQKSLSNTLNTPLGGILDDFSISKIKKHNRFNEVKFDIPVANSGKKVTSNELSQVFKLDPNKRFSSSYCNNVAKLNIESKGFFTGSIDLVFIDNSDLTSAKWWIADWKSNWLGNIDRANNNSICNSSFYLQRDLEKQMILHHYPLQAHLYLLALHRFLKWRLKDYNPKLHLGGYIYIFIRGTTNSIDSSKNKFYGDVPGVLIESTPINRILELDRLLREGSR
tara:strand:+ start:4072 stop:7806 length:3735 start_codon:yes stop_codon:yes gene_type:complete